MSSISRDMPPADPGPPPVEVVVEEELDICDEEKDILEDEEPSSDLVEVATIWEAYGSKKKINFSLKYFISFFL